MRENDARTPLPPGLPPLRPRGGWRPALVALAALGVVTAVVAPALLRVLGERRGVDAAFAVAGATALVIYARLRADVPRLRPRHAAVLWVASAVLLYGVRVLLGR